MQSQRRYTRRTTHQHAWQQRLHRWRCVCWLLARAARRGAGILSRRRQHTPPVVIVLGRQPAARRLRRSVARAVRAYARALGTPLPPRTTVLVMPAVIEDQRLHGLVELLTPADGGPRWAVITLATRPHGRPVSEDDLLAVLRQQVTRLVEAESGRPVVRLRVTLSAAAPAAPAAVVPLHPRSSGYRNGLSPQGRHDIGGPSSTDQWPDDDPA